MLDLLEGMIDVKTLSEDYREIENILEEEYEYEY